MLVDGVQQQQYPSSRTISSTELLVPTEPSSVETSAGAGSINQGSVPVINTPPNASRKPLGSVTLKQQPKKKWNNHRRKQHVASSEACHGAVATASPKQNRKGGGSRSTAKQLGAPYGDGARCAADAELTKVIETPVRNSRDVIPLLQESNVPPKELNCDISAAGKQAPSDVVIHISPSAALQQAHLSHNNYRPIQHSTEASLDRRVPDDEGNLGTRFAKEQVRETPSQPVVSTLREPQHLGSWSETGLSRTSDAEQGRASQVQGQDMKKGSYRGQRYAPPFGRIDENANPRTSSTSRTFQKDLGGRPNRPMMQHHGKTRASDNAIDNRVDSTRHILSSNTQRSTAPETASKVLIPRSRYKLQRIPIHAEEIPTGDDDQEVQGQPASQAVNDTTILNSMANKDKNTEKLPIDVTTGETLPEKEGGDRNVEIGRGKPTPSQRNRIKMRRRKEQAHAAAGTDARMSMQFALTQAQPSCSPQPHLTEEPSQLITTPNANIDVNASPPSITRHPVSAIGQIQNLLRGMRSDYGNRSRGSSMGRSRGKCKNMKHFSKT